MAVCSCVWSSPVPTVSVLWIWIERLEQWDGITWKKVADRENPPSVRV